MPFKGITMPYIESLFYYLLIVFAVLLFFYLIIFLGIIIANFLRGKSMQNTTIKKIYKWFTILFLVFALGVYVSKSASYYAKGRAYPEAKAYAVVGDTLSLVHAALLGMKINHGDSFNKKYYRLIYPDSPVDKKIQKLLSGLLQKMYRYIPEEDGERAYWYYKCQLKHIATMDYGFMRREDYELHGDGLVSEGFGIYTQKQVAIHKKMLETIRALQSRPMKDKVFDRVNRYSSIFRMSYYVERHFSSIPTAERTKFLERYRLFEDNATAFGKYKEFIYFLDEMYANEENNTALQKKLNAEPLTKAFVLGALLRGMQNIISYQIKSGIYPCGNKEAKRYLHYHKLYDDLVHSKRSTKFIKGLYWQLHSYFYAAKYICGEDLRYMTPEEKLMREHVDLYHVGREELDYLLDVSEFAYGLRTEKMKELKKEGRIDND